MSAFVYCKRNKKQVITFVKTRFAYYLFLILAFFVYACSTLFSKQASEYNFISLPYVLFLVGAVAVLGIFAIMWQQIIKKMPISDAYMFKGTSLIFILLLSHIIFGEMITVNNMIGAAIIIGGIALYAKS